MILFLKDAQMNFLISQNSSIDIAIPWAHGIDSKYKIQIFTARKMKGKIAIIHPCAITLLVICITRGSANVDPRWIQTGATIGNCSSGYADQPYCTVVTLDQTCAASNVSWVCTVTHNQEPEGHPGEKVYTTRSCDRGRTWTPLVPLEPQVGPTIEYAYSTILQGYGGTLYQIYVENDKNITTMPGYGHITRTDMLGSFFMRWSTDDGHSWSEQRVRIPIRVTKIDQMNEWNGTVQMQWNVDKGFVSETGEAYIAFSKIGTYVVNPPTSSWILHSPNFGTAKDPNDIKFVTLPEGDDGVHNWQWNGDYGISEEPHVMHVGNESLYMVFRTDTGFLGARMSSDRGSSWHLLSPNHSPNAQYLNPIRPMKNPRGPTQMVFLPKQYLQKMGWPTKDGENGAYLILWYFNGHKGSFANRNPYWLSAGFASSDGSQILWSDPEIALYTIASGRGPGYPDFILDDDGIYVTETQKIFARVHKVENTLIHDLLNVRIAQYVPPNGTHGSRGENISLPAFPFLNRSVNGGFSIVFGVNETGIVFDSREGSKSAGVVVAVSSSNEEVVASLELYNSSGILASNLTTAGCASHLPTGINIKDYFFSFVVDGGANVITAFLSGVLCDGGEINAQGWTAAAIGDYNGISTLEVPFQIEYLSVYDYPLKTSAQNAYWKHLLAKRV